MSNEELVTRIQDGEDVAGHTEQLYVQMRGLIRSFAGKYRLSGLQEDLEQEGYLALYPAIEGYDPSGGCKFSTYAAYYIQQAMNRYIQKNRSSLRASFHEQEQGWKYQRLQNDALLSRGRELTDWETAYQMGISVRRVKQIRDGLRQLSLQSLDSPITGRDGGEDATAGDLVAAPDCVEETAVERVRREELRKSIWECVSTLPGQQAQIIRQRYRDGKPFADIAESEGITQTRARNLHAMGLRELRKSRNRRKLLPFLEGEIYSAALKGNGAKRYAETWTSSTERVALHRILTGHA